MFLFLEFFGLTVWSTKAKIAMEYVVRSKLKRPEVRSFALLLAQAVHHVTVLLLLGHLGHYHHC